MSTRTRSVWLLPAELGVVAVVGGVLYALTGQIVVWVLGGVVGAAVVGRCFLLAGRPAAPSPRVRKIGQLLVGAAIGPGIAGQSLGAGPAEIALLVGGVLAVLATSVLVARVYARYGRVDGLTAGMATLPGGVGIMPTVAAEYGRPAGLVAFVQSIRLTLVLVVVVLVLGTTGVSGGPGGHEGPLLPGSWWFLPVLLAGSVLAWLAAERLRVPVPSLLGPLLFGAVLGFVARALGAAPEAIAVPVPLDIVGQALLGITIGEYLGRRYRDGAVPLLAGVGSVAATCGVALALAAGMAAVSPWSFFTCLLMVAPGGAPEMVVVAAATGSEVALVLAAQTGRQVVVNLLMPLWIKLFSTFDRAGRPS